MKKNKKNSLAILSTLVLVIVFWCSCNKTKQESYKTVIKGYIYNVQDSTPFADTKFKLYKYNQATPSSSASTEESYFYTDEKGYFNHTSEMQQGSIVWPSYYSGAGYTGPPHFGNAIRSEQDEDNRIKTYYYDTLYTTSYQ